MDLDFLLSILMIVGIDIVLGGDNAIVIALASRNLAEHQRNKAIFLGTGLAIVLRVILTIAAVYLLAIPFLQLVGSLLLLFIAYNLLTDNNEDVSNIQASPSLFGAVRTIVFADLVMGFDNVLAVAGAAHGNVILVVLGLIVSIPIIIWGSKVILVLMERFPALIYVGAGILAHTAAEMATHEERLAGFFDDNPLLKVGIQVGTVLAVLIAGYITNQLKLKRVHN